MWMCLLILALPAVAMAQIINLKPYNITSTAMFFDADSNLNGNIDRREIDESFREYDADGNGRISRSEYTAYIDTHEPTLRSIHDALFDIYDVDNDHILDEHDFDNFYALMDGDANGVVSHYEFVRYWSILLETLEQSHGKKK